MKKLLAIACTLFSLGAAAQTPTTRDYSDLWYNASESGWGMNVIHQGQILFVTLFVYAADRGPTWYVASGVTHTTNSGGVDTYTGDLYATTGPAFNAATFDPATVANERVGTLTFVGRPDGTATVTYTVGASTVTKAVVRQVWAANAVTGARYRGYINQTNSGCTSPGDNGTFSEPMDVTNFTITNTTFGMTMRFNDGQVCTVTGNYTQAGRMGKSVGTVSCTGGQPEVFTITDLQVMPAAFSARFTNSGSCQGFGTLGGGFF